MEPPRRRGAAVVAIALLVLLLHAPAGVAADEEGAATLEQRDTSGEGWTVPGTKLWVGGDVTVTAGVPENEPAFLDLDDISLLARYEVTPRLSLFTELRLEDTLELIEGEELERGPGNVLVERLYAEALLTPHLTLRLGKVYTPFGIWNQIRRAPLTWTVEEPAVAERTIPRRATGLTLVYQATWHGWSFDATGYGPAQDKLALRSSDEDGLMAGGRVVVGRALGAGYLALGTSTATYEDGRTKRWANGTGADLELTVGGHVVTGEFMYTKLRGPASREWGFYLQDAIPIVETLYGVLRVESFQPAHARSGIGGLVGLYWRPIPHLILKADYQFGDAREDVLEPGFVASVAIFF